MPKPSKPKRIRVTAEQMLGDVRRVLVRWSKLDEASGADFQQFFYEVRAAAWAKHK